jgi:peptide deformylase
MAAKALIHLAFAIITKNPVTAKPGGGRGPKSRTALESWAPAPHRSPMAILTILEFPDPRLRTRARPVERVDDALRALIADMFETMYAAPGVGLAATQVNVHQRFMVIDVSEEANQPLVFINPEIVAREGTQVHQEGCLSVPGIYADVERAEKVRVQALDRDGKPFEIEADGLLAVCIQHEMDHLEGKVFVDYLSPFKREQVRRRLEKQKKAPPPRAKAAGEPAA